MRVDELVGLIAASDAEHPARQRALELFDQLEPDRQLDLGSGVSASHLAGIYRRRNKRAPADVLGLAETADAIEGCAAPQLFVVSLHPGRDGVTAFITDEGQLVAYLVGPDRRDPLQS